MSGPQWGQPDESGQQPGQPQYGQPQYGQPQDGQPQYGQPQYEQPQYGEPQYGEPQYGEPQYGEPQYGEPQYGQSPAHGGGGAKKGLLVGLGAAVVAGVVVLALFLAGVFDSDSSGGGSSPSAAVRALFDAAKSNDQPAVRNALCRDDQAIVASSLLLTNGGRLTSYTIGKTTQKGANKATVHAMAVTSGRSTEESADIPTAKEDGQWKVCFGSSGLTTGLLGQSTSPSDAGPGLPVPIQLPSGIGEIPSAANICTASGVPSGVARFFVTLAQIGSTAAAQRCVYQDTVSSATTADLTRPGTFYVLVPGQSDSGSSFTFRSMSSDATITVSVSKEPDGLYYVTGVTKS